MEGEQDVVMKKKFCLFTLGAYLDGNAYILSLYKTDQNRKSYVLQYS